MKYKNNYTRQEVEEMIFASRHYTNQYNVYLEAMAGNSAKLQKAAIKILNESAEDCNKKIPKSLIDRLGIKKIE